MHRGPRKILTSHVFLKHHEVSIKVPETKPPAMIVEPSPQYVLKLRRSQNIIN